MRYYLGTALNSLNDSELLRRVVNSGASSKQRFWALSVLTASLVGFVYDSVLVLCYAIIFIWGSDLSRSEQVSSRR